MSSGCSIPIFSLLRNNLEEVAIKNKTFQKNKEDPPKQLINAFKMQVYRKIIQEYYINLAGDFKYKIGNKIFLFIYIYIYFFLILFLINLFIYLFFIFYFLFFIFYFFYFIFYFLYFIFNFNKFYFSFYIFYFYFLFYIFYFK